MTPLRGLFGYTEREAEFLQLAALGGGYFCRQHFNQFIGKECGAISQRFIERTSRLGHVEPLTALGGRIVYHVHSHSVYVALEDSGNRNRRRHETSSVRRRLLGLDFLLGHLQAGSALTRQELRELLADQGAAVDLVVAALSGESQPLLRLGNGGLCFGFVDDGRGGLATWRSFLKRHRPILQGTREASVCFISPGQARAAEAETVFRMTVSGEGIDGALDRERLHRYFDLRRAFEERRYEVLDQARMNELRESRKVFAGANLERHYQEWLAGVAPSPVQQAQALVRFRFWQSPRAYEWLCPVPQGERRAAKCH